MEGASVRTPAHFCPVSASRRRPASSFLSLRHCEIGKAVGDIHHRLDRAHTGAAIEVGRVMEDVEFRHRFVIFIHTPQLVDNALNLTFVNIARRQREPASLVTTVGFRTNRGIDLFGLTRLKLLDKFVRQINDLLTFPSVAPLDNERLIISLITLGYSAKPCVLHPELHACDFVQPSNSGESTDRYLPRELHHPVQSMQ